MTENSPYLIKNTNLHIQETQRTINMINIRRSTPRLIIAKILKAKDKEKILESVKENVSSLIRDLSPSIMLTADFSLKIKKVESSEMTCSKC